MGKRSKKSKRAEDSIALSSTDESSQSSKTTQSGRRSKRQSKKKPVSGAHSAFALSAVSYMSAHGPDEDVEVDVDTVAIDDTIPAEFSPCANGAHSAPQVINIQPDMFDSSYDIQHGFEGFQEYNMELSSPSCANKLSVKSEVGVGDALVPTVCPNIATESFVPNHCLPPAIGQTLLSHAGGMVALPDPSASSLMIPTSLVGGGQNPTAAANTAFAHVTKIEESGDGSGYVLHLNIPALGLSNVVLSTPGLSLAPGTDEKLLASGSTLPTHLNINVPPPEGTCVSADEGMGDSPHSGQDGPTVPQYVHTEPQYAHSELQYTEPQYAHTAWDDELYEADTSAVTEASSSSSSSDSGCGLGDGELSLEPDSPAAKLVTVARWVEKPDAIGYVVGNKPEVERFVICSDGPMECVLCSFKTIDYSAFKSHIICSHPCWRITKKLSKNRLLVEKAVKMNVNLVPQNAAPNAKIRRPNREAVKSENSATKTSKKGLQVYQRKKQMLERNKRLFRCSVCMRLFVFEGSIVNHLVDIHLVKSPYDHIQVSNNHGLTFGRLRRCSQENCYASCVSEAELERHHIESHAQVVYRCQICGFTADSASAVESHASQIHNNQDLMYGLADDNL